MATKPFVPWTRVEQKKWFVYYMLMSPASNMVQRRSTFEDVTKEELMRMFLHQSLEVDRLQEKVLKAS